LRLQLLFEYLEEVDLVSERVDVLNSFSRRSFDAFLSKFGWVVSLLVVDIHDLALVDERGYFLVALASLFVFALHKIVRNHLALYGRSVTIEVDLRRVIKAEQVWPEPLLNSCLTCFEFECVFFFILLSAVVVGQRMRHFLDLTTGLGYAVKD